MRIVRSLNKPYYLYRPRQLAGRVARIARPARAGWETARLPWGLVIRFRPDEMLGSSIARTGVFELPVTEAITRLLDRGEVAVDAGANIGYMTSLMALRVGPPGLVLAFEPHPDVFAELSHNAEDWARHPGVGRISLHRVALSSRPGRGTLRIPQEFERNRGTATLAECGGAGEELSVELECLDRALADVPAIGMLKLDVEGHELAVLEGARALLRRRAVRDVLFEEHDVLPTVVTDLLQAAGYRIFGLAQRVTGPRLVDPASAAARPAWDAPTYLATLDPGRAQDRLARRGWKSFRRTRR